ncbi:hypothetical protein PG993_007487 [Apiospora rasikravindrae]|uniref:T6SS Phospholipase effector Tle1-like catalytic domain-containing protein n=1 Tax=Apiospora rasikravindrae TaxID=990691 RepID=A0ABR1SXL7_9PEZI
MMTEGIRHQKAFSQTGFQPTQTDVPQTGFINTCTLVAPKRIVVCCDGTWQSSVSGLKNIPSNITRLSRAISRSGKGSDGKEMQQVVYYDAGIGTGVLSSHEKNIEGGFGIGFVGNVIEAYNFIVLNYELGDEIFCFGFSRGAYTARAVAGLVNDIGVISPRDMQDFPDLHELYQKHKESHSFRKSKVYREWVNGKLAADQPPQTQEGGFQELQRWEKPPHRSAPEASRVVQVVGVFDTVGSLGIPDMTWTQGNLKWIEKFVGIPDPGFHNVALSPYIRHAFHALALDERRGPFSPTLWHYPTDGALEARQPVPKRTLEEIMKAWHDVQAAKNPAPEQVTKAWSDMIDCEMYEQLEGTNSKGTNSELLQVWFPGVHINVGGGSDDLLKDCKGDFEQIAMISFAWMCEQIAPYLQLDVDLRSLARVAVEDRVTLIKPVLDRIAHGEKDFGSNWLARKGWEALDWSGLKKAQPKHVANDVVNGWATGPIVDSFSGTMTLAGAVDRTPGRYVEYKEKGKSPVKLGETHEMIHPSVEYRMRKKKNTTPRYDPEGLKGFRRDVRKAADEKKRSEWTGSGKLGYEWTYEWTKTGNTKEGGEVVEVLIPEYLIKPEDVFSRYVAMQDSLGVEGTASQFINEIDKAVGK